MSIINQVLQDLEQRQSRAAEGDESWQEMGAELSWPGAQVSNRKRKKLIWRVAIVIVLSMISYGLFITYYHYKDQFKITWLSDVTTTAAVTDRAQVPPDKKPSPVTTNRRPKQADLKPKPNQSIKTSTKTQAKTTSNVTTVSKTVVAATVASISSPALASQEASTRAAATEQEMQAQVASSIDANQLALIDNPQTTVGADDEQSSAGEQTKLAKTVRPLTSAQLAELSYQSGYQLLQRNHMAAGEAKLVTALSHDARHIKAREMLVGLLAKTGRKVEAKNLLEQGMQSSPHYTNFAKFYARMLWDEDKIIKAVNVLKQHAPALDVDPDYHAMLAASLQRNKQHQQAAQLYVKLLKQRPREGMWWVGMAISLEALGKKEEALSAYAKARESGNLNTRLQQYSRQRLIHLVGDASE